DDQFEILSLASAPTPARAQKFDPTRTPLQKEHKEHREPPPDIDAITSLWNPAPALPLSHARVTRGRASRIPRPFMIAGMVTAVVAIGALLGSRWFFAPAAAPTGTGMLTVSTNPPGAQVIVDGESRGVTPLTMTLSAGVHAM